LTTVLLPALVGRNVRRRGVAGIRLAALVPAADRGHNGSQK
jgi:hypothetical protein